MSTSDEAMEAGIEAYRTSPFFHGTEQEIRHIVQKVNDVWEQASGVSLFEARLRSVFADYAPPTNDEVKMVWDPVVKIMNQMGVPARIESLSGHYALHAIRVDSEDPTDYVLVGVGISEDYDYPFLDSAYIYGDPAESYEDALTVRQMATAAVANRNKETLDDSGGVDYYEWGDFPRVPVTDPMDDYQMAEAMVGAYKQARDMDLIH